MPSNFVGLLFIFYLGTLTSSVPVAVEIRPSEASKTDTSACIKFLDKYMGTNDTRLQEYFLRAARIFCQSEHWVSWKTAERISECTEHGIFPKIVHVHCKLTAEEETVCSARAQAINCVLDLAGVVCGGKDAILLTAFQMEYMMLILQQGTAIECEITALQARQKQPENRFQPAPLNGPQFHIHELCKPIADGFAKLTSDPEYFEQRAAAILCDGKESKKFVKESNECFERALADPDMRACRPVSDDCIGKTKELRCQAELFGKQCGGQPAVDVFAFETELSIEYTRKGVGHPRVPPPIFVCRDEIMAELRALQKPKEDSSNEN